MANWDYKRHHVQPYHNAEATSQLGSKAVLIAVGPPTNDMKVADRKPIVMGFVQNLSMQQQKQIMEVFEVGSERRYFVDNPTRNMMQLSRALISGPSLLKIVGSGMIHGANGLDEVPAGGAKGGDINSPGAAADANLWINLAADLFSNPLGIELQFKEFQGDGDSTTYGTIYLQNCKVQSHGLSMQSQQWMLQEDMSLIFEHVISTGTGSSVQDTLKARKDIMNAVSNSQPSWFSKYDEWKGTAENPSS